MKTNNVRAVKDSSYTTTLNAGIMEEYNEWSYMTRRGQAVLLANNAEKVLIIVEGEKILLWSMFWGICHQTHMR